MYKIVSALGVFIRQFVLPNPFTPLDNHPTSAYPLSALINLVVEPILILLAYKVAGLYYFKRRDTTAKGSFLYLLFYSCHVALLYIASYLGFAPWAIITIIIGYISLHVGLFILRNRL